MKQPGRQVQRRQRRRRRLLTPEEFAKLIEGGKTIRYDRRRWTERRKSGRRTKKNTS